MKLTNRCPKCGSTDVIADAVVVDNTRVGHKDLTLATYRDPDAVIFKGQLNTTVSAWVCSGCGFVELYADSPKALKLEGG